jgi:hypothetical protein
MRIRTFDTLTDAIRSHLCLLSELRKADSHNHSMPYPMRSSRVFTSDAFIPIIHLMMGAARVHCQSSRSRVQIAPATK